MNCPECKSDKQSESPIQFDYSKECGIENISISSARRFDCGSCGITWMILGSLKDIDLELAKQILAVERREMAGAELRFVRTRIWKLDLVPFSNAVHVDVTTLTITEENELFLNYEASDKVKAETFRLLISKGIKIEFEDESLDIDPSDN